jgi:hypothetical protein
MNFATHTIGDSTPVINRFGTENSIIRPEKLMDVLCYNNTGGTLYMQVFDMEIGNSMIPFETPYAAGTYTLTGLTIGHTYSYAAGTESGTTDVSIVTGAQTITFATAGLTGTFIAQATTLTVNGTGTQIIGVRILDLTVPSSAQVPATGSTPTFSFPVQAGLGGTLGRCVDMSGVFCAWSSTAETFTPTVAASGAINIVLKG